MAYEQFANNAASTLSAAITSTSATSLSVTSASAFPSAGNFRIIIDSEIIIVGAVSGTTFSSLTRGAESTTAATHLISAPVTQILTKGSLLQLMSDMNLSGAFSSRPAAGVAGRKYYCTDCPFWYLDNGSSWQKYYGSYPIVTPNDSGFSWDNQSSAVITTTQDMVNLLPGTSTAFRYIAAPSTPYNIDTLILPNWGANANTQLCFGFRESSTGQLEVFNIAFASSVYTFNIDKYNTSTSFNSAYTGAKPIPGGGPFFLRIQDNGTVRNYYVSMDGVYFNNVYQVSRTSFLTANQVCWGSYNDNDGVSSASMIHWYQH